MRRCEGWHRYNWWRPRCCRYHLLASILNLFRPWVWGGPLNFLDGDGPVCLRCGKPTVWFKPAPLGEALDAMSLEDWVE